MKMDETFLRTPQYQPPASHPGYCPVLNGVATGRYKYFETARAKGGQVIRYDRLAQLNIQPNPKWPLY